MNNKVQVIKFLATHHFGSPAYSPLARTSVMTEAEINTLHRDRWSDFPSKLNKSFIGYNVIIYPKGEIKQYRYIGEETAANKGHNLDTVSICLAGNFSIGAEKPTVSQVASLKKVMRALLKGKPEDVGLKMLDGTVLDITPDRILPHRRLSGNTECCGTALSDTWAKDLLKILTPEEEKTLVAELTALVKHLMETLTSLKKKRLGSVSQRCWDNARG